MTESSNKVVEDFPTAKVVPAPVATPDDIDAIDEKLSNKSDELDNKFSIKSDRLLKLISAIAIIMFVTLVALGATAINLFHKLEEVNQSVTSLDQKTSDVAKYQQQQLGELSDTIDGVRGDMEDGFADQQEQISNLSQVQRNSNAALTRMRRDMEQLRKDLEEGLELRRKQIEAAMAASRYSGGNSGGVFSSIGDYARTFGGGVFELTAYEWTGNPCANGEYPIPGYTVASNWFPIGTRLYIEGIGERVVTDTGGMSNNVIDIYMGDPETCIQFGRQTAEVYVIED